MHLLAVAAQQPHATADLIPKNQRIRRKDAKAQRKAKGICETRAPKGCVFASRSFGFQGRCAETFTSLLADGGGTFPDVLSSGRAAISQLHVDTA
jgi:hypothetical protein